MTKKILKVMATIVFLYIAFLGLWILLERACEEKYGADQCYQDEMTEVIKVGYGWYFEK
jgi:hypothetical protein